MSATRVIKIRDPVTQEQEFIKRVINMENDSFICQELTLSKNLKKFTEDWTIIIKLINIYDGNIDNSEIYILKFYRNGQLTCTCKDFLFKAKELKIACKHLLFILEKYTDLNYSILLENGFILNKHLLEQYEYIIENIVQNFRCRFCLNIDNKIKDTCNTNNVCNICEHFVSVQNNNVYL